MLARMRIALFLLVLHAAVAHADIPPDPRWLGASDCTAASHCPDGGRTCPNGRDVDQAERERCEAEVQTAGLEMRCAGGGNYQGFTLYCPPDAPGGCSIEEQCPGGHFCEYGDEECVTEGFFTRCSAHIEGDRWRSLLCPDGSVLPPPGQNAPRGEQRAIEPATVASGCSCRAGHGAIAPLALVMLALAWVLRR
jgi:MYXO-CTERM domain-containing protein